MTRIEPDHDGTMVWVSHQGGGGHLHALVWRDSCRCEQCRNPTTDERRLDSTTIHPDLTVDTVEVVADGTVVGTCSDGHHTHHRIDDLAALAARSTPGPGKATVNPAAGRELWDLGDPPLIPRYDPPGLEDPAVLYEVCTTLRRRGVVVIDEVAPTGDGLEALASRFGPIMASNYGRTWEIEATVEPVTEVDSQHPLAAHTDLPYRRNPPGLQIILVARSDVDGGATTLVDGFATSEAVRLSNPHGWNLLTRSYLTYRYQRTGVRFDSAYPLITLDPETGAYLMVRRAPDLVGVPLVEPADAGELYRALGEWTALVDDEANQATVRLGVGQAIVFDNHRILHGRTGFSLGASGRRHLLGCYIDQDDLTSRRLLLADTLGR